ncbi:Acetyltransferase (GNAT) family protein [Paenibacillus algorifonticola]|uniref:Acetyltransferase (GNAT) family protein n=1 Tax=Paenibacillus algorifonticola TaxID=684063 RepID=A0A1I1Y474_9BACL|nr:GNAT family N-acetyltransferase [Paenibacillus algorifonticola]SFE14361.1 Acetyltransferase (GNAT) family protein [Paenibacillus algorifonticola]
MYTYQSLQTSDLPMIATFPQNEDELFYMFPSAIYPLTPEQILKNLPNRLEPTVIMHGATVACYANFYKDDNKDCWLGNVIVSPDYRGKGAASFLIGTMEMIAKEKLNVTKLNLLCHNTNTRGLLFYKKLGYKPFDISLRFRPSGEHVACVHMEKHL